MSKGSGDRVTDKKRFDENYEKIDWGFERLQRFALAKYKKGLDRRRKESPPKSRNA